MREPIDATMADHEADIRLLICFFRRKGALYRIVAKSALHQSQSQRRQKLWGVQI
jgi:hypothetical protein